MLLNIIVLYKTHKAVILFDFWISRGYHYCSAAVLIMGFSFLSLHFGSFLFFLSVNALLTLLMPYVSGLVLFNRSFSHTKTHQTGVANALVRY